MTKVNGFEATPEQIELAAFHILCGHALDIIASAIIDPKRNEPISIPVLLASVVPQARERVRHMDEGILVAYAKAQATRKIKGKAKVRRRG